MRVASPEQAPKGPTIAPVMCIMTTASVQARDPLAAHRNRDLVSTSTIMMPPAAGGQAVPVKLYGKWTGRMVGVCS